MTGKVTVHAQSHPCEVRLMPRVGDNDLWNSLSEGTKKFSRFEIPVGETREYAVHRGQSVAVREVNDAAPKIDTNAYDELRATPQTAPPGRYLLRGRNYFDKPYEAEFVEWSDGGRLRLRHRSGSKSWLERNDIPFVIERLASGTEAGTGETEGLDPKGDGPTAEGGDAQ